MAWEVLTTVLKELNFEYNGTVQKISPVNPCILVYSADGVTICANPYSTSTIFHGGYDGTADYAAISAQISGSLDLCVLGSVMSNNTTAYIYRNNRNIRLELTKQAVSGGNTKYTVRGYAYGTRALFFEDESRDPRTYQNNKIGLVFLRDEANGKYQLWDQLTFVDPGYYAYLYMSCGGTGDSLAKNAVLDNLITGNEYIPPASDQPYGDDDYDQSTGGSGDHDDTSDTIAESTLPSIGASNSGFCTAFVPTIGQIQALAQRLTDPTIYQAVGNTVLNISDVIIGLHVLPVAVPKETSTRQVCVNFLGIGLPAGVYIDKATTQFVEVDCGSLNVTEYWGNCVDYNPYTQIGIFLPFCGFYELDTDDVMGKTIAVSYRVDIMSGACLATIKVDGSVLYQYTGDCANQIPVNSVNFDNFLANAFNMAIATSTGGAGLAAAGAGAANSMERLGAGGESSVARQLAEENVLSNYQNVKAQTFGHLMGATAGAVISAKGQYKHAGCLAGSPGFLGVRKPYLIIKRPEQIIPGNFGKYHGFPANTGATLGDLSGYTVVDEIRLNIPDATVDEILECEKLLKGGIVI